MELIRRYIIGNDKNLEKRNMIWNMIGSFLYAFASMALTIAVVQIVGGDQGGIFTFAFSTFGQHMFMAAYFGIRPYQITDMERRYTFGEYLGLRYITCAGALVFGILYLFYNRGGYSYVKTMTVFLMVCYKVIDGFADTYEAEFQRSGRLYLTGKSNAFRTILSVSSFLGVLAGTKDLVLASLVAVGAQVAGVLVFDVAVIRKLPNIDWSVRQGRKLRLFRNNLLLFFSVILDFYIFSASKYAIEGNMTDGDLAVYGAIFMPTSVINLVAGFVIRPYLTDMSLRWEQKEYMQFKKIVGRLFAVILALTVLAVGGAYVLGIPVLSVLYSNLREPLAACRLSLIFIILGGAFNAVMNLFYYSLIIMQRQRYIFYSYIGVCILALVISPVCVRRLGILGASVSYMILMIVLMLCFGIIAGLIYTREKKKAGKKGVRR